MKRKITAGNILYTLMMVIILIMLINPAAKSSLIRALMNIGFFRPDIPVPASKKPIADPFNISFKDTHGKMVNTTDLKGKVIFVNFWATWCPPCIAEMPSINKLYAQFKNNPNVVFMIVDVDNDYSKANGFMQKHNYNLPMYTLASDVPGNIMDGTIPTTLVFDNAGRLVYQYTGAADYNNSNFTAYLNMLIKKPH
ncbi:TlpA disulfide reductase family protein [Mucilaginibacter sabulilitoris]|uniref:TlpA disulfide reductase family protein n=1 Tax=Mucilaginibacter sabulilitoris TaxID=1173583 RepID=A0ABZ0TCV5_9SPHI|nr:TlpA disulfide reductase family protein [Mucilaginibacter sabulilitoris]WPU91050.1 TlpA disulfide reductase family protein [Mucilaginibacter sabulilitoris]